MLDYVGWLVWEASHLAERVHCAGEAFDKLEISQSPIYLRVRSCINTVSLSLNFGRRHLSKTGLTLQLRPMPRRLSLATAGLLRDGGSLLWVKLGPLHTYTNDDSLASASMKLYSPPCRAMHEQPV
jgi:hypothetical protein